MRDWYTGAGAVREDHPVNCTCPSVTDTSYPEGLGDAAVFRRVVFHVRRACQPATPLSLHPDSPAMRKTK